MRREGRSTLLLLHSLGLDICACTLSARATVADGQCQCAGVIILTANCSINLTQVAHLQPDPTSLPCPDCCCCCPAWLCLDRRLFCSLQVQAQESVHKRLHAGLSNTTTTMPVAGMSPHLPVLETSVQSCCQVRAGPAARCCSRRLHVTRCSTVTEPEVGWLHAHAM